SFFDKYVRDQLVSYDIQPTIFPSEAAGKALGRFSRPPATSAPSAQKNAPAASPEASSAGLCTVGGNARLPGHPEPAVSGSQRVQERTPCSTQDDAGSSRCSAALLLRGRSRRARSSPRCR